MQIQNSIHPVSPAFLQSDSTQFNQKGEMFHDIFQHTLNNKSDSRPLKIELTGILVPCQKVVQGYHCNFKLETDSEEYFLRMSDEVSMFAKKIEWEEIRVKGFVAPDNGLFEVEKIKLAQRSVPFKMTTGPLESDFEFDQYKRTIARRGKLDLAPDYLAS